MCSISEGDESPSAYSYTVITNIIFGTGNLSGLVNNEHFGKNGFSNRSINGARLPALVINPTVALSDRSVGCPLTVNST